MTDWNPFEHHRGPFTFVVTRPKVNPRKRSYPFTMETLLGTTSGVDVDAEAKALLADPRDTIVSVAVWSVFEQQHILTYRKDDQVRPMIVAPIESVVTPISITAPPSPTPEFRPTKRTRGAQLAVGKTDGWPASRGAQIVRQFFSGSTVRATAQDIVTTIGGQLTAAGIEFPSSLISRLKQAGFLTEAA